MNSGFTLQELTALQEVIREYLTELRTEIDETEDLGNREVLKRKEENLSIILAKIEKNRVATFN